MAATTHLQRLHQNLVQRAVPIGSSVLVVLSRLCMAALMLEPAFLGMWTNATLRLTIVMAPRAHVWTTP